MIKSLFITGASGEVLIERHWRGVTPRSVVDFFWDEVNKYDSRSEVPPILHASKSVRPESFGRVSGAADAAGDRRARLGDGAKDRPRRDTPPAA